MFWPGSFGEHRIKMRHAIALQEMVDECKDCGAILYAPSRYQPVTTRYRVLQQDNSHMTIAHAFRDNDAGVLPRLVQDADMLGDEYVGDAVKKINGAADAAEVVVGQIQDILDPILQHTPIGDGYYHENGGSINVGAASWHRMYDGHKEQFGQIFTLLDTLKGHQKEYDDGVRGLASDLRHGLKILLNRHVRWSQEGFSPWRGRYVTFERLNNMLDTIGKMNAYGHFVDSEETGLKQKVTPKPRHAAQEQLQRLKLDTLCNAAALGEAPEQVAQEPPELAPEGQPQDATATGGQGDGQPPASGDGQPQG